MTVSQVSQCPLEATDFPEGALIVLVGTSGSGKSTVARSVFAESQIVSSDRIRGWISDDESNQDVSSQAFDLLHRLVGLRLAIGRTTVVDATSVSTAARAKLLRIAHSFGRPVVAVVLDVDVEECVRRNARRSDRQVGRDVIESQRRAFDDSLPRLDREGFDQIRMLRNSDADV